MENTEYSLSSTLTTNPLALLAFFKVSCPVCQLSLPYLERLHRSYYNAPIWGISQDDVDATTFFARTYGITFPILLDSRLETTVNYGLTNVPSVFLVTSEGMISQTTVGFVKAEYEAANKLLAEAWKTTLKPLFTEADDVPNLAPG